MITRRLLAAGSEIAHAPEAEYVVINENFERALAELECIVAATRLRFASQYARHTELFIGSASICPTRNDAGTRT